MIGCIPGWANHHQGRPCACRRMGTFRGAGPINLMYIHAYLHPTCIYMPASPRHPPVFPNSPVSQGATQSWLPRTVGREPCAKIEGGDGEYYLLVGLPGWAGCVYVLGRRSSNDDAGGRPLGEQQSEAERSKPLVVESRTIHTPLSTGLRPYGQDRILRMSLDADFLGGASVWRRRHRCIWRGGDSPLGRGENTCASSGMG